jgi:hypothetical protein
LKVTGGDAQETLNALQAENPLLPLSSILFVLLYVRIQVHLALWNGEPFAPFLEGA